MVIKMIEKIYEEMLKGFPSTLKEASADDTNSKFMTSCQKLVVKLDDFKDDFRKKLSSNCRPIKGKPMSCDALLYMTDHNVFFMIEFKNGRISENDIRIKVLDSLLMLSEKFNVNIKFTRDNMNLILVHNEDTNKEYMGNRRNRVADKFGLEYSENIYFKNVSAYSKAQFEERFVRRYCT
jgi:hypothetical protein